ncbi:hypothetical protein, partial [Corallococcus sp. 4LFB]|uniref:hypothetical protein n=1 Tax=Corallococcus sp. 4LFB TaxID=3383249 RepID=UPI003975FCE9
QVLDSALLFPITLNGRGWGLPTAGAWRAPARAPSRPQGVEDQAVRAEVDARRILNQDLRIEAEEIGTVITFADARQVMEHIRMFSGWPEFNALLGAAKPVDVRVYGELGEDAHAWLRTMNVVSKVLENPVAGFVR